MFRVTYIRVNDDGPELVTLTHPNKETAMTLHDALKLAGVHVRLWSRNSKLIRPPSQQRLKEIQEAMLRIGWE